MLDLHQGILLVNSRFALLLTKVIAAPDSRDSHQVLIFIASLQRSLTKWVALVRVSCSLAQVSWLMLAAGWLFLFSVLMAAGLLFTMVFFVSLPSYLNTHPSTHSLPLSQIIMFSDLECDYINPIDLCNKLNQVFLSTLPIIHPLTYTQFVLPENIAHAFLTILFLLSGQWFAFLLNLPLVLYNANKYVQILLGALFVEPELTRHTGYATRITCMTPQRSSEL